MHPGFHRRSNITCFFFVLYCPSCTTIFKWNARRNQRRTKWIPFGDAASNCRHCDSLLAGCRLRRRTWYSNHEQLQDWMRKRSSTCPSWTSFFSQAHRVDTQVRRRQDLTGAGNPSRFRVCLLNHSDTPSRCDACYPYSVKINGPFLFIVSVV